MERMMQYGDFFRGAIIAAAVALSVMPFPAAGQQGKSSALKVFSCEINGRSVYGDTLPQECYGRAWVEKRNGVIIRREEAQPTADESLRRREKVRQQEQARQEAARQKRQNDALLERYSSLEALDQRRDYEIAEFDKVIGELRANKEKLDARRKGLEDEMKALGEKQIPDDLKKAIHYADEELARARAAIEKSVNQRDSLRQRFDADRRQYLDIISSGKIE